MNLLFTNPFGAVGNLEKGNELLLRTETWGFALLLCLPQVVERMGSVAWPGALPFPGGGAEKRTHTLWLVFGRSVTPLLGV